LEVSSFFSLFIVGKKINPNKGGEKVMKGEESSKDAFERWSNGLLYTPKPNSEIFLNLNSRIFIKSIREAFC